MLLLRASPGGESPLTEWSGGIRVGLVADGDDAGDGGGSSEVDGTPIGSVWVQYCREVLSPRTTRCKLLKICNYFLLLRISSFGLNPLSMFCTYAYFSCGVISQ